MKETVRNNNLKLMKKRLFALGLSLVLCTGTFTGCGDNTKVVFTTGLSGNQVFKIGSMTCTMPELMVYLTTFYNQYANTYGEEMWHYDFGGISLEEHVKDVVISKMAQIKTMNLMAEEYDISLSEEEEANVREAAGVYYGSLSESLKKEEKITKKTVEKVYREYAIANKVYTFITESADMEISDDEARSVTVQSIYFPSFKQTDGEQTSMNVQEPENVRKKAEECLQRVQGGESFESAASHYHAEYQAVVSYARGDAEESLEEAVFSLDEGECSGVVQTSEGYYIVKCISTMDYEATQQNKLVLAEKRKREAFSKAYTEVAINSYSQFRDKLWEKVTLDAKKHCTDADFFEIYRKYMKE